MRYRYILALAIAGLILAVCSVPSHSVPFLSFPDFDKFAHAGMFTALAFVLMLTQSGVVKVLPVLLGSISFGIFIEFWQGWLPIDRNADVMDVLADGVGSILGICLYSIIRLVWQRPNSTPVHNDVCDAVSNSEETPAP